MSKKTYEIVNDLINWIGDNTYVTQKEIACYLGVSQQAIVSRLRNLVNNGTLRRFPLYQLEGGRGRPQAAYRLGNRKWQ